MLDALRSKLEAEPDEVRARVTLVEADYHAVDPPGGPFQVVLWPFNALHHCADPVQLTTLLRRARAWAPQIALDAYLPDRKLYDRDPDARYEFRTFTDPRTGEPLQSWEQGWWDEPARIHHVVYVYARSDGSERRVHLQLRMFELAELRQALADAGWRPVRELQDFGGALLGPGALKWVAVARPR
jgi:hypothetical protein